MSEVHDITLQTLSPIYIGAGKEYGASEFLFGKAKLKGEKVDIIKRIDLSKYYSSLPDDRKDKFTDSLTNSKFELSQFDSKINKEFVRYNGISKIKCIDKDIPVNEISEHIKTSDKLYIPGSSIKGSIKTAIFYDIVDDEDIEEISHMIYSTKRGRNIDNRKYNKFINSFFSAERGNPAQTSIFRFMQIADTNTIKRPTIEETKTVMATPDGRKNEFYSRHRTIVRSFLETIPRNSKLKSRIVTNYDSNIYYRLGIDDVQGILDLDYIKKALYNFSKDLINYELDFSKKYKISYLNKFYNLISKHNTIDTPLLRVGSGSGLMGTSINMKIKDLDPNTFNQVQETFRKSYDYEFPKSRKITAGGLPFGWIKLNFNE